nr:LuxR C-terminal-related transcriptional regulator [Erwinia oleae]
MREADILNMPGQGLSGSEIAKGTKVSSKIISMQKKSAMYKLNVKKRFSTLLFTGEDTAF